MQNANENKNLISHVLVHVDHVLMQKGSHTNVVRDGV